MATKHEFELGDRVRYTHVLKRNNMVWKLVELPNPTESIIVGVRNLTSWGTPGSFKAYLIATTLTREPARVLPEHITKIEVE